MRHCVHLTDEIESIIEAYKEKTNCSTGKAICNLILLGKQLQVTNRLLKQQNEKLFEDLKTISHDIQEIKNKLDDKR